LYTAKAKPFSILLLSELLKHAALKEIFLFAAFSELFLFLLYLIFISNFLSFYTVKGDIFYSYTDSEKRIKTGHKFQKKLKYFINFGARHNIFSSRIPSF